jgi:hypothetical protein
VCDLVLIKIALTARLSTPKSLERAAAPRGIASQKIHSFKVLYAISMRVLGHFWLEKLVDIACTVLSIFVSL